MPPNGTQTSPLPTSPTLALRARGPLACFTRPELKVERVSYPVMAPSAARGLVEAILWKPAIRWHIERIHVLSDIRFLAFRRNEVSTKASKPSAALVAKGGEVTSYFADEDRAQRNTVALRDVDYLIEARFSLTRRAGPEDTVRKFLDMFHRRLAKGQCFHQPYLGCRELVADFLPPDGTETAIADSRDLGLMLWDIDFSPPPAEPRGSGKAKGRKKKAPPYRPLFFPARLERGVLEVPLTPPDLDHPGAGSGQTGGAP